MTSPLAVDATPMLSKQTREKEVVLYIGGVHASDQPIVIKTLLGSCIAVCLYDPVNMAGGMNHFMLPRGGGIGLGPDATRFGVHAMDCLISAVMKVGGDRRRCVAKCFGGAHVLDVRESAASVPQQNVEFIRSFLDDEGFRIVAEDMGGYHPRHVLFHPRAGRAFVKHVAGAAAAARMVAQERRPEPQAPQYGAVTLFE